MTVEEFLDYLDGNGLIITDYSLLHEVLVNELGVFEYDKILFDESNEEEIEN